LALLILTSKTLTQPATVCHRYGQIPNTPDHCMSDAQNPLAILFFSELLTVEQLLRNQLARALPKGMELSHFSVLNQLAHIGNERTPAQLAKSFHVTRGAMTNTLSKLEMAGYIHIRPDWDDARRKLVALSPAGSQARDAALSALTPMIQEVVEQMGEDKTRLLLPVLRDLRLRLGAETEPKKNT